MAVSTLSDIPNLFRAGDTVRFRHSSSIYPSSEWTAKLALRGRASQVTIDGEVDPDTEDGFLFTLTSAETKVLLPGPYSYCYIYTETASGEKESSNSDIVQVVANLDDGSTGPRRAAYEKALLALQSWDGIASFNINGEQITYTSFAELQKFVDRLHIEALQEDRERGIVTGGGLVRIRIRM